MERKVVWTDEAPKPVGPYSQAVVVGNLIFTSGQIGIDPKTGELVQGVEAQTEQVFKNLEQVLLAAGSGFDRVIKATVFITDMKEFGKVNSIYARFFKEPFPARSTVEVSNLPKGALVEIEVVAER